MPQSTELQSRTAVDLSGKYLTFILGTESFGLEILKVREIIGYMDITSVPRMPAHVKGVINLRGSVIPVIDLRSKFRMPSAEVTEHTCIIVVEITQKDQTVMTGIVVDQVSEVLDIETEQIESPPHFDSTCNVDFILGIGKIADSVKILLDIDKVLGGDDLSHFV